jgi:hypothetical protein
VRDGWPAVHLRTAGSRKLHSSAEIVCCSIRASLGELANPGCISHPNQTKITSGHPGLRGAANSSRLSAFRPVHAQGGKRRATTNAGCRCRAALGGPGQPCRGGRTTNPVSTSPVNAVVTLPAESVEVGSSGLVRSNRGIAVSLQASGLRAGHAVTVWWMVVNPGAAAPSLRYAAGQVVDDSGTDGFGSSLEEGDTDGLVQLPGLSLAGLPDATGATVVLVVGDHGPAGLTSSGSSSTPSTSPTRPAPTCSCRSTRRAAEQADLVRRVGQADPPPLGPLACTTPPPAPAA